MSSLTGTNSISCWFTLPLNYFLDYNSQRNSHWKTHSRRRHLSVEIMSNRWWIYRKRRTSNTSFRCRSRTKRTEGERSSNPKSREYRFRFSTIADIRSNRDWFGIHSKIKFATNCLIFLLQWSEKCSDLLYWWIIYSFLLC